MHTNLARRAFAALCGVALVVAAAACGDNTDPSDRPVSNASSISGSFAGHTNLARRAFAALCGVALVVAAAACGDNTDPSDRPVSNASSISGSFAGAGKTLDVHIKRIRAKIERDPSNPSMLTTVRGLGYRISGEPSH